jgi:hypothetical protein
MNYGKDGTDISESYTSGDRLFRRRDEKTER